MPFGHPISFFSAFEDSFIINKPNTISRALRNALLLHIYRHRSISIIIHDLFWNHGVYNKGATVLLWKVLNLVEHRRIM